MTHIQFYNYLRVTCLLYKSKLEPFKTKLWLQINLLNLFKNTIPEDSPKIVLACLLCFLNGNHRPLTIFSENMLSNIFCRHQNSNESNFITIYLYRHKFFILFNINVNIYMLGHQFINAKVRLVFLMTIL
jgi:hypothetical protein